MLRIAQKVASSSSVSFPFVGSNKTQDFAWNTLEAPEWGLIVYKIIQGILLHSPTIII